MLDKIADLFQPKEERPNKFTRFMGERIKTAREEAGFSQEKLAEIIYIRRATLSDIENGKTESDTSTFVLMAYYLNKPLAYFLPPFLYNEMKRGDLDPGEQEVLLHFKQIMGEGLRKLAISLVKVIANLYPEEIVLELEDLIHEKINLRKAVQELNKKQQKRKRP